MPVTRLFRSNVVDADLKPLPVQQPQCTPIVRPIEAHGGKVLFVGRKSHEENDDRIRFKAAHFAQGSQAPELDPVIARGHEYVASRSSEGNAVSAAAVPA